MSAATIEPAAPVYANIPVTMADAPRWCVWKFEPREPGEEPTKIPYNANTGRRGSSIDPQTWATLEQARRAFDTGGYTGIGFYLGDGFAGVDLDDCIGADGIIRPEALLIITMFDTYSEISPSGTGVKLFMRAAQVSPEGTGKAKPNAWDDGSGKIEMYASGRFFAVTGRRLDETPATVEDREDELRRLYGDLFPPKPMNGHALKPTRVSHLGDDNRVERCRKYIEQCPEAVSGNDGSGKTLRAAAECWRFDLGESGAWDMMRWFNSAKCSPEWSERELSHKIADARKKVESAGEIGIRLREERQPSYQGNGQRRTNGTAKREAESSDAERKPVLVRLSNVQRRPVDWLWQDRIARGKLNLIYGDPGLGKSTVTLDMAARVTTGSPWPDDRSLCADLGTVILLSAEDDIADTIAPRLDLAGADTSRVLALQAVEWKDQDGKRRERTVTLADLPILEDAVQQHPDTRLVIIDPVSAYMGSDTDSHKNSDVRGLLAPLAKLAADHKLAVVLVTHINKSSGGKALHRAMGSLAFIAAARTAWLVCEDKADPARRLFLMSKNNLAPDRGGLAFRIIDGAVSWEDAPVNIRADEALALAESPPDENDRESEPKPGPKPKARNTAADWLEKLLASGPMEAAKVKAEAAAAELSWSTVRRAQEQLGIEPSHEKADAPWVWSLPPKISDAQVPVESTFPELGHL